MEITKRLEKVLILNTKPNKNNRVYELKILELARDQINSREKCHNLGMLGIQEEAVVTMRRIAFMYENARIENEALYVDIEILSSNAGAELKQILEIEEEIKKPRIVFRPNGFGTYINSPDDNMMDMLKIPKRIAEDYQLISISAIPFNEDAIVL
jgi:hypothetical protein